MQRRSDLPGLVSRPDGVWNRPGGFILVHSTRTGSGRDWLAKQASCLFGPSRLKQPSLIDLATDERGREKLVWFDFLLRALEPLLMNKCILRREQVSIL